MKLFRNLLAIMLLCGISNITFSQETLSEPDFSGECFIVKADGSKLALDKQTAQMRAKASFKAKLTLAIDGCCSNAVYSSENSKEIKLVVRADDNKVDPLSIITIAELKVKKKRREMLMASINMFGGQTGVKNAVSFTGKKYGESSYLLTIKGMKKGKEYGIVVSNPNQLDQRSILVSTVKIQ